MLWRSLATAFILIMVVLVLTVIFESDNPFIDTGQRLALLPLATKVNLSLTEDVAKNERLTFIYRQCESIVKHLKPIRFYKNVHATWFEPNKRGIIICNHMPDIDWLYIISFLYHHVPFCELNLVYWNGVPILLRRACEYLGWAGLERKPYSEKDTQALVNAAQSNSWVVIYPEGAFVTEETLKIMKHKRRYLQNKKNMFIPHLIHLNLPRPRGLTVLLQSGKFDILYDFTIAYDGYSGVSKTSSCAPTLSQLSNDYCQGGLVVNLHKYAVLETFGLKPSMRTVAMWLNHRWKEKDVELDHYMNFQTFG